MATMTFSEVAEVKGSLREKDTEVGAVSSVYTSGIVKISPQEKRWNDDYERVAEMVFGITWVVADSQLEVIAVGRRVQEGRKSRVG